LFELAGALARHDCGGALKILEGILEHGKDIRQMMMDLMDLYRDVLVMLSGGKELEALLDQPRAYKESLAHLSGQVPVPSALAAIDILIEAQEMARVTESPRLALDVAFARISALSSDGGRPASSATPAVPAVRPPVPPRATPSGRLQNNKGSVSMGPVSLGPQSREGGAVGVSVSDIEREWTALTHAVSQVKMSAGTCLQEGFVSRIEKGGVVVSFPSEAAFSKEMLESSETLKMLGRVFSEHMKTPLRVTLEVSQGEAPRAERAEALDQALKIFGGEVVNEWHNEEAS
ncbi:MAG: hypothetical protein GX606_05535, partial [Elusimicrobia bacterium]|nr:hypothetical protein [Elusimicrobiota bacterium]